jgi:hypothetical protein
MGAIRDCLLSLAADEDEAETVDAKVGCVVADSGTETTRVAMRFERGTASAATIPAPSAFVAGWLVL